MEYKDVNIGTWTFRIRLKRSFKAQCDIQKIASDGYIGPDDVIKADVKVKILNRDEKGKVQGEMFIPVDDILLEEVNNYRFKKKLKSTTKRKQKQKSG